MSSWLRSVMTGTTSPVPVYLCVSCDKPATRIASDGFRRCDDCGPPKPLKRSGSGYAKE
jgi:ribosomal protein L37AE/L43A